MSAKLSGSNTVVASTLYFPSQHKPNPKCSGCQRCFVTTKSGDLRDDACGEARSGGNGTFHIDAAYGYKFGVDDGSGLGGTGAEVRQARGNVVVGFSIGSR